MKRDPTPIRVPETLSKASMLQWLHMRDAPLINHLQKHREHSLLPSTFPYGVQMRGADAVRINGTKTEP